VPAPFRQAMTQHEAIVAETKQVLEKRRARSFGRS